MNSEIIPNRDNFLFIKLLTCHASTFLIMPGLCVFNDHWLDNEKYKKWLKQDESNKRKAYCTACKKTIDLGSMGEGAIMSHAKGKWIINCYVFVFILHILQILHFGLVYVGKLLNQLPIITDHVRLPKLIQTVIATAIEQ